MMDVDYGQYEVDDELLREEREEAEVRAVQVLGSPLHKMERARLVQLEDVYMPDCLTLTFWRLHLPHQGNISWLPGLITKLECLRRLENLLDDEDASVRYEAGCDIEARLYQGQRRWL